MINIILWILFGALAGWIASMLVGTDERQGALGNIVTGILGAFLGGFLVSLIGGEGFSGFNLYSLVVAIAGAALLSALFNKMSSRSM